MTILIFGAYLTLFWLALTFTKFRPPLLLTLIIGAGFRLLATWFFADIVNYDTLSYGTIADFVLAGRSIYPTIARAHYPYLPLFLYIEAFTKFISSHYFSQALILKIFLTLVDLGNVFLLFRLSPNSPAAIFYAVSPIVILVTNVQGQFDTLPIFFLLVTAFYFSKKHAFVAVLFWSLAVTLKTWPLIAIGVVWQELRRKFIILPTMLIPIGALVIYTAVYDSTIPNILDAISYYRGLPGLWGLGLISGNLDYAGPEILTLVSHISTGITLIIIAVSGLFPHGNFILNLTKLLLLFFATTITIGSQWFIWLVPFLLLTRPTGWRLLLTLTSLHLTITLAVMDPNQPILFPKSLITITGFITWISLLLTTYKIFSARSSYTPSMHIPNH